VTDTLERLRATEARLQEAIQGNLDTIASAEASLEAEHNRRASADANFRKQVADLSEALAALAEARTILESVAGTDLSTLGFSFIQTQHRRLTRQLSLIQAKVANLRMKTSPMAVYIKQLVQIAQDAEVAAEASGSASINADLFDRIFQIIQDFDAAMRRERDEVEAANEEDARISKETVDSLTNTIDVTRSALAQNQHSLEDTRANITLNEAELAALEGSLEEARGNLHALIRAFEARSEALNGYIDRLERDVDVLERALVYVRSQNSEAALSVEANASAEVGVEA
jgi:chromosome segregation ATPase